MIAGLRDDVRLSLAGLPRMPTGRGNPAGGHPFQGRRTIHVQREVFRKAFKAAAKRAGLPDTCTSHGLRHAFAFIQIAKSC
ncbi:hypothetical protein ACSDR0_49620 [Streptosporangium sp. G11]|uniref:hypothetical protein n=1 Tax=Streptosporangium sp. G11 TaxID=3436926 RepID=UPI003EBD79A5